MQHVTTLDKEDHHTFCPKYQELKMTNFLQLKLFSAMKPQSNYQKMFINITREFGRANNLHEVTEYSRDSPKLNMFCVLYKQKYVQALFICQIYCGWHNVPKHVAEISHAYSKRGGSQ